MSEIVLANGEVAKLAAYARKNKEPTLRIFRVGDFLSSLYILEPDGTLVSVDEGKKP